jgi:acyl-CoA reductase-like NAD-dependent aldehyde dehydrogenase
MHSGGNDPAIVCSDVDVKAIAPKVGDDPRQ